VWLTCKGSAVKVQLGEVPFDSRGLPSDPRIWERAIGDARVPLGRQLQQGGDVAYAFAFVHSPEARDVRVRMGLVGAEARVRLNGVVVYDSGVLGGEEGERASGDMLAEAGSSLRKGWNALLVEVHRTGNRYLNPSLALLDAHGSCLRDLLFSDAQGD
jgi:hypothetical protein